MRDFCDNGIKFMELTSGNSKDYQNYPEMADEIYQTAAKYGVTIRSVHLPFSEFSQIDPAHLDKSVRENFLKVQYPIIEAAGKSGIKIAVVHPSGEPYKDETREERLKYAIESLSALCDYAEKKDVKIAIENLPRSCLARDCKEIKKILDAIPNAFACFDTNHSLKDANTDIIKTMGEKIIATHVSDYDFVNERHLFPGDGKNDWEAIMSALEEVGYEGTWNYEIRDRDKFTADVFKENHRRLLNGEI